MPPQRLIPVGTHTSRTLSAGVNTVAIPTGASEIYMQALTANIRFTINGTDPTASSGFELRAGDPPVMVICDGVTLKFINEASGGILEYQFMG